MAKMTLRELAEATDMPPDWRQLDEIVERWVEQHRNGFMGGAEVRLLMMESLMRGERVYEVKEVWRWNSLS